MDPLMKTRFRKDGSLHNEDSFRCILCWPKGDIDNDIGIIEEAFESVDGIELVHLAYITKIFDTESIWKPEMRESIHKVLKTWGADIAVIGQVKKSEKAFNMWFVPHEDGGMIDHRHQKPYELVKGTLQEHYHDELRAQITSAVLTTVAPFANTKVHGRMLESGLVTVIKNLKTLLEGNSITKPNRRTALYNALGNTLIALGEREHERGTEYLEEAVNTFYKALNEFTRERTPLDWATTQNNLGNALHILGKHNSDDKFFEQAIIAYRASLEEFTREHAPLDWATAQNRLGNVLHILGERKGDDKFFEQAIIAYRASLEEFTREHAPLDWAGTQNNLDATLQALGKRNRNTELFGQAVDACHTAIVSIASKAVELLPTELSHSLALYGLMVGLGPRKSCDDFPALAQNVFGLNFANPVAVAAGFDKNARTIAGVKRLGGGFVEVGSVTPHPQPGNPPPRVFRLHADRGLINRMGFNNDGAEAVLKRVHTYRSGTCHDLPLGINLAADPGSIDPAVDFVNLVTDFAPVADYLAIDVSCPNTANGQTFLDPRALERLLSRLNEARDASGAHPAMVAKLAPNLELKRLGELIDVITDAKIDAIIVCNTTTIFPKDLKSRNASKRGGLSGKPLFEMANQVLRNVYLQTDGKMPLIGVGGIMSGADAYTKICAGASLVQLYTGLVYRGPWLIQKIKRDLDRFLKRDGFKTLSEAVGSAHRRNDPSSASHTVTRKGMTHAEYHGTRDHYVARRDSNLSKKSVT